MNIFIRIFLKITVKDMKKVFYITIIKKYFNKKI